MVTLYGYLRLTSSDHRRAVRPRMRQKASASHLKMLNQRQDVTSEIMSNDDGSPKVDPNDYATYMSKHRQLGGGGRENDLLFTQVEYL